MVTKPIGWYPANWHTAKSNANITKRVIGKNLSEQDGWQIVSQKQNVWSGSTVLPFHCFWSLRHQWGLQVILSFLLSYQLYLLMGLLHFVFHFLACCAFTPKNKISNVPSNNPIKLWKLQKSVGSVGLSSNIWDKKCGTIICIRRKHFMHFIVSSFFPTQLYLPFHVEIFFVPYKNGWDPEDKHANILKNLKILSEIWKTFVTFERSKSDLLNLSHHVQHLVM